MICFNLADGTPAQNDDALEAARIFVDEHGANWAAQEITSTRSDLAVFWDEVDRLLTMPVEPYVVQVVERYIVSARSQEDAERIWRLSDDRPEPNSSTFSIEAAA